MLNNEKHTQRGNENPLHKPLFSKVAMLWHQYKCYYMVFHWSLEWNG